MSDDNFGERDFLSLLSCWRPTMQDNEISNKVFPPFLFLTCPSSSSICLLAPSDCASNEKVETLGLPSDPKHPTF